MDERIKMLRQDLNLTQEEFGDKLGVSQNYVWMLESGTRQPSARIIRDICREYGVSETWLRTGEGPMYRTVTREEELSRLVESLFADRPESFRSRLIRLLLGFDPAGKEWELLEKIYNDLKP